MTTILYKNYYPKINLDKYILTSFDLDNTIIKTKSGNVYPKNIYDWELLNDNIKPILQKLYENNNNIIVIFSNQKNLRVSKRDYMKKINKIRKELGINFIFMAALEDDIYRKPNIGMYKYLKKKLNIKFDKKRSFFVGDMAGRKTDKTDFDIKFALNAKINFMTPEEYFIN
jgi:bifunctional polynucleotide phosphatase/kinase